MIPEIFFLTCVIVLVGALIINVYIPSMHPQKKEIEE